MFLLFCRLCQTQPSPVNTEKHNRERENNHPAFGRTCHVCLESGLGIEMTFPCGGGGGEAGDLPGSAGAGVSGSLRVAGADALGHSCC